MFLFNPLGKRDDKKEERETDRKCEKQRSILRDAKEGETKVDINLERLTINVILNLRENTNMTQKIEAINKIR